MSEPKEPVVVPLDDPSVPESLVPIPASMADAPTPDLDARTREIRDSLSKITCSDGCHCWCCAGKVLLAQIDRLQEMYDIEEEDATQWRAEEAKERQRAEHAEADLIALKAENEHLKLQKQQAWDGMDSERDNLVADLKEVEQNYDKLLTSWSEARAELTAIRAAKDAAEGRLTALEAERDSLRRLWKAADLRGGLAEKRLAGIQRYQFILSSSGIDVSKLPIEGTESMAITAWKAAFGGWMRADDVLASPAPTTEPGRQ